MLLIWLHLPVFAGVADAQVQPESPATAATGTANPAIELSVPDRYKEITTAFRKFLNSHPGYQLGHPGTNPIDEDGLQEYYRTLMQGTEPCDPSESLTVQDQGYLRALANADGNLSRAQMVEMVKNFEDPRNFVEDKYSGPYSGYHRGDHWGLISKVYPGAAGFEFWHYGWMRADQKTIVGGARRMHHNQTQPKSLILI